MAKASSTLHQPARTATTEPGLETPRLAKLPSELEPDPKFAAEVDALRDIEDLFAHLVERRWVPSTPAELSFAVWNVTAFLEDLNSGALGMPAWLCDELNERDSRIAGLERRLALLEQRLDPDADWERPNPRTGTDMGPLDDLFDEFHHDDGSRIEPAPR